MELAWKFKNKKKKKKKMCVKMTVISIIIGALGTMSKNMEKTLRTGNMEKN